MIKLIRIEILKLFKHKSIYFIFLFLSLFCFANNFLYKLDYDKDGRYKYDDAIDIKKEISVKKKELARYDVNNNDDKNIYVTTKTELDVYKGMNNYDKNSWQYIKYNDYLYSSLYEINYYTYIDKDKRLYDDSINNYNKKIKYFKDNNWKYFVNEEKKELENKLKDIKTTLKNTKDKGSRDILNKEYKNINNNLLIINYRINKGINYSNNYLNRSLLKYQSSMKEIDNYKNKKLSFNKKIDYYKLLSDYNINKYIINNRVNILKQNSLNYQLRDIVADYELFIVIIILLTTSILIGEEFNKGTIKLLLIKPFSRNKILASKFITSLVVIIITIIYLIINELIFGALMFGVSSLNIPVAIYDFNLDKLRIFNIFIYMFINILSRLPMYMMLVIISYLVNLIIISGISSFAITMLFYTFSEVINSMIINYKIKIFKYIITLNWNFNNYLFGNLGNFEVLNLKKSFFIYLFYVIILLGLVFINFNKKNIKNV